MTTGTAAFEMLRAEDNPDAATPGRWALNGGRVDCVLHGIDDRAHAIQAIDNLDQDQGNGDEAPGDGLYRKSVIAEGILATQALLCGSFFLEDHRPLSGLSPAEELWRDSK